MKYALLAFGALFLIFALVLGGLGLGYLSFGNTANSYEVSIKATYTNNQNVYDNGWKRVLEISQIPAMQADQVKSVYDGVMHGRYGANGSQAMVQVIKEQNPNLDPKLYRKIAQQIEIFHNQFESNQTKLISQKEEYERFLTATTSGRIYNGVAGFLGGKYPRIDMDKYGIVTSDETQSAFDTKRAGALQVYKPSTPASAPAH
jgi:hypothetical protein